MSTRSGRIRPSAIIDKSPVRTRKGVSPSRSPARTRKTSPKRKSSPPARSPSRKSPSRKSLSKKSTAESKFPARKSPSRSTKESTEKSVPKSPKKRAVIRSNIEVKLEDFSSRFDALRNRTRRSEYSIKDIASQEVKLGQKLNGIDSIDSKDVYGVRNRKPVEEVVTRRSSRLRDFIENIPDIRRSFSKTDSKSVSKSMSQSLDAFSDEENSEEELKGKSKSKSVTRKLATPLRGSGGITVSSRWEFGGRIGSGLMLILLPMTAFAILISCTKSCSISSLLNLSLYKPLSHWYSLQAVGVVIAQYIIQAIIAITPVCGRKADRMDDSGSKYCFNALFSSVITLTTLFTLDFFKIFESNSILSDYLKMAVVSYIVAVALSLAMFVKGEKADDDELNQYGNTGYTLYDFWMGRELHPQIFKLNVKIWTSRFANISALILAVLILKHGIILPSKEIENLSAQNYKEALHKVQFKPTILLFSMMQIIYCLNFIMREYKVASTFFWQSEGVGYLQIVSSALYPFYFTTISKFVVESQLVLSTNALISASVLFFVGFLIMLISNNIKHEFRANPMHTSLSHLNSMPTFHGKKLLLSNLWGIIRHPNYTGDILIHIALALPGIISQHYIASAPALLTIVMLVHRAWRDHARCRRRYGAAWQRYCAKVNKVFIPKVI